MALNQFAAQKRMALFDRLKAGLAPDEGVFDAALLAEARVKGQPQMGATRYEPTQIHFEFIYPDSKTSATVLVVTIPAPERIVFLPVPAWVVESIWQGEISGSYHFESEARAMVDSFVGQTEPEANVLHFGPKQAVTRRD